MPDTTAVLVDMTALVRRTARCDWETALAGTSARLLGCRVMLRREFDVSHLPEADSVSPALIVEGARQNNLKNISVLIPHNQVTGVDEYWLTLIRSHH